MEYPELHSKCSESLQNTTNICTWGLEYLPSSIESPPNVTSRIWWISLSRKNRTLKYTMMIILTTPFNGWTKILSNLLTTSHQSERSILKQNVRLLISEMAIFYRFSITKMRPFSLHKYRRSINSSENKPKKSPTLKQLTFSFRDITLKWKHGLLEVINNKWILILSIHFSKKDASLRVGILETIYQIECAIHHHPWIPIAISHLQNRILKFILNFE